ncbi:hypothetical protein ABFS82_12G158000 [Erythranthe guttata]
MEGKRNISDYRNRLDKTLSSPDLTNDETLRTLVKNQILLSSSGSHFEGCIENVVERRSKEVSNFLTMLRSASVDDGAWKLKQDTDEFRVMYREGHEGSPFHTLLVEGYVDGPVDVCLCISWESVLYSKWWPQSAVPTFKIVSSQCLQRLRTGEQISLVRMKVSWPLSGREALIHYFAFDYFQDDLVVVLLNSIPDSDMIDRSSHGFTREGIPNAEEVVRIDVVGGFALQKVTANRSYFRTIANMDIKLDFVPPAFINFISRQLIGSGFKLYKKEIASVCEGDEKFREALMDPLYVRTRGALYTEARDIENPEKRKSITMHENQSGVVLFEDNNNNNNGDENIGSVNDECVTDDSEHQNKINEIEELEEDESTKSSDFQKKQFDEKFNNDGNKARIRPEVGRALDTLEKIISVYREDASIGKKINLNNLENEEIISSEVGDNQVSRENEKCGEASEIESQELSHASREKGLNSCTRETRQIKIVPASVVDEAPYNTADAININGNIMATNNSKKKKHRFCCLHLHLFSDQ